jgi:hypothetical protein
MLPKGLEGVIVDQTGSLVIQLRKQIVQDRLTPPDKVRISLGTWRSVRETDTYVMIFNLLML